VHLEPAAAPAHPPNRSQCIDAGRNAGGAMLPALPRRRPALLLACWADDDDDSSAAILAVHSAIPATSRASRSDLA
jgi:hypothetical protein